MGLTHSGLGACSLTSTGLVLSIRPGTWSVYNAFLLILSLWLKCLSEILVEGESEKEGGERREKEKWVGGHGERGRMSTIWWKFLELTGQVLHLHLPCICM